MKVKPVLTYVLLSLATLMWAKPSHALSQGYYSECSFIDRGPDSGGDVYKMPCYIIEGASVYYGFFHILWKDGTRTIVSFNLKTDEKVGSFYPLLYRELYENPEGDLIHIGNLELTSDRFDIIEEGLVDRIL